MWFEVNSVLLKKNANYDHSFPIYRFRNGNTILNAGTLEALWGLPSLFGDSRRLQKISDKSVKIEDKINCHKIKAYCRS